MNDKLRRIIETGVNMIGASSGAAISVITGNPEFGIGSAAVGATGAYQRIGTEIANRVLAHGEQKRIGGVLALSAEVLKEKLENGHTLRDDGFFDTPKDSRSCGDEILEGLLRKAQTEYEEKKIPYLARFWANSSISESLDVNELQMMMKLIEQLTYRHFTIISMLGKIVGHQYTEMESLRYPPHNYETDRDFVASGTSEIPISIVAEIEYLDRLRCVQFRQKTKNDFPISRPPHLILGTYGVVLNEFMELWRIPESDRIPLAKALKWPLAWRNIEQYMDNDDFRRRIGLGAAASV